MKTITLFMDEITGELFETPAKAIESEKYNYQIKLEFQNLIEKDCD